MANHKSAEKRTRQAEKRNEANRRNRSQLRTEIKKLRAAIEAGNREEAAKMLGIGLRTLGLKLKKWRDEGTFHEERRRRTVMPAELATECPETATISQANA